MMLPVGQVLGEEDCDDCDGDGGVDVNVGTDVVTYVVTGGGSKGPQASVHPDTMYPHGTAIYYKIMQWNRYTGSRVVHKPMLKPYEKVERWTSRIKWSGNNRMPDGNNDVMYPIWWPPSSKDLRIFTVEMASYSGGMHDETEEILLSWGGHWSKGARYITEIMPMPEGWVGGAATGSGGSLTKILDDSTGAAFAVTPAFGYTKTGTRWPYKMRIKFFNNGSVYLSNPLTAKDAPQKASRHKEKLPSGHIVWVYFNTDKSFIRGNQAKKVMEIVKTFVTYYSEMKKMKHVFIFNGKCDVRYEKSYNDTLGMERSKTVRNAALEELVKRGFDRAEMERMLLYVSSGWRTASKELKHDDRRVEVFRATELSRRPKDERNKDS
jgi:hypothetical protein